MPLAYAMIEQEIKIISVLSGCILAGSWLAGGGANSFVSWMSSAAQGALVNTAINQTARSAVVATAMSSVGGAATTVGSAAHTIWKKAQSAVPSFRNGGSV